MLKNYLLSTCNDGDNGRIKTAKLAYHMFTCKFPVSYITMSAVS